MRVVVIIFFIIVTSNIALSSSCEKCKQLIKSFRSAFLNSASNFEGGNTAWEELHLGQYAVSESRFLAITEQVYADHHEPSFNQLFNQLEEYIENWWTTDWKNGKSTIDELQDIVCIEKALLCCPINKFGPQCLNCSTCFSYGGICNGNGTRHGSGLCNCKNGYTGSSCNACNLETHFPVNRDNVLICNPCHYSCSGGCLDSLPTSCKTCASGWTPINNNEETKTSECSDINECIEKTHDCAKGEYCSNTDGSFSCFKCDSACLSCNGSTNKDCIFCAHGYALSQDGLCEDVNECRVDNSICKLPNEHCTNLKGSFKCVCMSGFKRVAGKCVPDKPLKPKMPSKRKAMANKSKIIWTVPYTQEVLKFVVVICIFGAFFYLFAHRIIMCFSVAVLAVAYVCYQSRILDAVFNQQT